MIVDGNGDEDIVLSSQGPAEKNREHSIHLNHLNNQQANK